MVSDQVQILGRRRDMIFSGKMYALQNSQLTSKILIISKANACLITTPWPRKTILQISFVEYCSGFGADWRKIFPVTSIGSKPVLAFLLKNFSAPSDG